MNAISRFLIKLSLLLRRNRFRADLDEEMAFHRAQAERDLIAEGFSTQAAQTAVLRRFGNPAALRDRSHSVVAFRAETVLQDLRFALRQLRKNPGFAVTAILILALGMSVSLAIFGFVDAVLIQPLPYAQPNRLVFVTESAAIFPKANLSRYDYDDWKRMNTTLSSLDVVGGTGFLLRMGSIVEPVPAARISDGFFRTLGVKMLLGRDFLPGEDQPGRAKIAILPWSTWQKRFGGHRDVVGQSVSLDGAAYTIVGVLPREFSFAPRGNVTFWVPLLDRNGCETRRSCHNLDGVGRLRDSVTSQAAFADLKNVAAQLERQYPDSNRDQGAFVQPLKDDIVGDVRPILLMLLAGAALLLLIACVNVTSLLLVRSESRRREIAVRGALGATAARVLRQFVTEALLLTIAGCTAGLLIARWLMQLIVKLIPRTMADNVGFLSNLGINAHSALVAVAVALLASLLLAAIPALLLSQQNLHNTLAEGGRSAAGRFWQRLGANLVVVELTIAVVLLAGAGLLGKSLYNVLHVPFGFDPTHLATAYVMIPDGTLAKNAQALALYHDVECRASALPGVESVGITTDLPVQCNCDTDWIRIVDKPFHGEHNEVNQRDVSPGYLPALKARLVRGRLFAADETGAKPNVVLINEALARKYFPGEDPIGKRIGDLKLTPKSMRQIIGVVADLREGGLDQPIWPAEYQAIYQTTDNYFAVAVRTSQDPNSVLPSLVSTIRAIGPNLGVYGEITMGDQINASQAAFLHRFSTWIVGGFAFMALLLGVVGLYGTVAYSVSQRAREIGVRMALGAQRSAVYSMVMRQAAWLTGIGVGLGIACSIGASLAMRKLLFGVSAWDATTLAAVALVLAFASLAASFLPAHRAASVNPTEALRAE
ncbi:MAG TPA: ABC transporter permease [Terracidiphilus sp.]|jgi:predicted permease|nr:ABC transporter permease [Terracidiphilus sp.]